VKARETPRSRAAADADVAPAGLRLHEKPTRLQSLLREHQQLLVKIRQKKRELQRLSERLQATFTETSRRLAPLLQTIAELDRQLHALFAELLARRRQPRSVTAALQRIYKILQQGGVLSLTNAAAASAPDPDASADGRTAAADPQAGGHSAARPGASEGAVGQSLRGLFHRLAAAMHPDRAQHEPEKARRTEAMKELTRAYQDGDLARLLELERLWLLAGDLPAARDELDQRCATLLRTNAALRSQLDEIKKELKALRRSPQAELLCDIERSARLHGEDQLADAVCEAQEHGEHLRELLAFIGSFRDGEIGLAELLAGPPSAAGPHDELDPEVESVDFAEELLRDSRPRRRGKARHRAMRPGPAGDPPF
jgi:chromosome segregation ATPase